MQLLSGIEYHSRSVQTRPDVELFGILLYVLRYELVPVFFFTIAHSLVVFVFGIDEHCVARTKREKAPLYIDE